KRRRPQRRGRLREARPPRVRRRRMVDRGFGEHERDPRERRGRAVPRARPVRRRGGDRPRRPAARAVIRAQRLPVRRMRFTELSLLFWVAPLAITGFVAVVAAETPSFGPAAIVVPAVCLGLMLALHLLLGARPSHGDRVPVPIG